MSYSCILVSSINILLRDQEFDSLESLCYAFSETFLLLCRKAALMMAYSTDKSKLDFKNAVSLVKVTTQFACSKIGLSAYEDIAGTGTLSYNNGEPSIAFDSNQSRTVTLIPADGESVIAAGTYYIAIRPHTSIGFSIVFINSDYSKVYTRRNEQKNTFSRSRIKNLGIFSEYDNSWTVITDL